MNTTTWQNRALSVILAVIMVFSMLPLSVFAADSTPGTADNPLLISSAEEMEAFRDRVNKGETDLCARLSADIDLKDRVWTPIEVGTAEGEDPTGYSGTFDGNGHEIRGLRFNKANAHGLFAMIASGGAVQDLFLVIDKENEIGTSCGFIAAVNEGTIKQCSVEVTATQTVASKDGFGLIVAYNRDGGIIEDCYAGSAKITGNTSSTWIKVASTVSNVKVAGIAYDNVGTIKSCFFRGFLGEGDYAITAKNSGEVTNSYCFNPKAYDSNDNKYKYLYADEGSGYGYGDIGIHYSSSYSGNKNLTTQNGSLTWQLNNGDETGITTNNGPWRLHVATNWGSDIHDYPTLRKTDARAFKEADGTFRIEPPHFHEIDGEQVEFTQVRDGNDLCDINDGYVCLGKDVDLWKKWQPTGKVTLCLNGHNLYTTESGSAETPSGSEQTGYGIDLNNGADLTLLNCNSKNTGRIGGSDTDSAIYGVTVNIGGTLKMESGCIGGCDTGVIVDGGTFKMTGGEIKDCTHIAGIEYRSGSLTLGGHARVVDNTYSQNILLIQNGKGRTPTITFENPEYDAVFGICIGKYDGSQLAAVTDGHIAVTGENCEEYYKNLFADRFICGGAPADYDLYLTENGTIEIGVRGEHKHCLCGAEHEVNDCKDTDGNAVGHQSEESTTFQPWNPYDNLDSNGNPTLPTSAGSYYLTRSMIIESDGSYKWESQENVTLCLNGHTVTYRITGRPVDGNYEGWIRVPADVTLTVTDCSNIGTVACDNRADNNRWSNAFWVQGGTLNLYGGTVKGFMKAVYVKSGTLNMYGGTLTENCSSVGGGGVYVDSDDSGNSGTFNLYGGKIIGNMATENRLDGSGTAQSYFNSRRRGGGVYVNLNAKGYCGTFNMYGGEISGNGAARGLENDEPIWQGGGVYAGGDFTMTGGNISDNTAAMFATTTSRAYDPLGGGVYVGGNFTMTGGEITGNSLNGKNERYSFVGRGGGVYVGGQFTMTGGTISTNTVTSGVGGGVYVAGKSDISNARIEKNEVSYCGNATYFYGAGGGLFANGASIISKSEISENKVTNLSAVSKTNPRCSGGGGIFFANTSDASSTLENCTIKNNTLTGTANSENKDNWVGGGGVLVANGTLTVEGSTITDNTMTTTDSSTMLGGGILCYTPNENWVKGLTLNGKVTVKDNMSGTSDSNLYFEKNDDVNFTATVGSELSGGKKSIGVTKVGADGSQPITIAKAAEGYTVTKGDASCFFDDSGKYVALLADDSIQLGTCPHNDGYTNGICNICGKGCTHPANQVTKDADKTVCGVCGQQMAVKVKNGDAETYYAKTFDRWNAENTLQTILNDDTITPSGSTITLLVDGLQAWAHVQRGKTIKLDLNGKKLIETGNGICTSDDNPNNKLIVTGTGTSEENESAMFSRTFAVYGGTLEFDSGFGGEFNEIYAGSGTLTFADGQSATIHTLKIGNGATITPLKNGKFGEIIIDKGAMGISVKASSLLAMHYAFLKTDGSYVPYDTVITSGKAIENVTVVMCNHTGLPDNFTGIACPYCNATLVASVSTAGKTTGYATFAAALTAANAASGCTLTLLTDVSETLNVKKNVAIRLVANGHTVSSNVIVPKNASLTTTGGTFGGKVNGVGTLNLTGCALTGDLSVSGNVALNSCTVSKAVTVNESGTLTVDGGSLTGVTVNNGGALEFRSGNISGMVTARSGSTVTVSNGHIDSLTAENATLTLSGGNFTKITVSGKNLIDCLSDGCAFKDTNGIVDGRTPILSNVAVVAHPTHEPRWITATHEKVCACGYVAETDTTAPEITGITDGKPSYGDTTVTVTDKNLATVTVDGTAVTLTDGKYTIPADNKVHTITATDNAGNSTTVTVTVYKVYTVTLVSGTGYTVKAGSLTVGHGQKFDFRVDIKPGYSKTSSYQILVNGVAEDAKLTALGDVDFDECSYVGAEGDLTITVEGIADITAPEAEVTIGRNSFNSFLNRITFGLFFKETQTVTVSATDAGSGVKTVEYLLSDTAFKKPEDITGSWTEIHFSDGKAAFDIDPKAKAFIYVRVTDKAGNAAYINSDGVVIYTDSTMKNTESVSFTRLSDGDVSFKVNLNGNWFDRLLISDGKTTSSINGIISSDGTVTLKNEDLRKLAVGEYTITVTYRPMGENYVEAEGNEAPASTTVKLTVERATRTLEFSAPDAVYDGAEYDDLRINNIPATTVVQYKAQGAADSTYTTDAPKNVGDYTVRISVDADDNYEAAAFTKNFTLSPREVTIIGMTAESKTYNGNTEAVISGTAAPSVNYDGESLSVKPGKANFADKNVGKAKTVTFTDFELDGTAKNNYRLTAQPAPATADITAKNLTVENLKVKDKLYDGTDKAEIDGTPTLKGVEDGDDVQLDCGTPTFATTTVGKNIAIDFTAFTLTGKDSGNYTLTPPTGITAKIRAWNTDGSEYSVNSNDWINTDFTVTAKDGYQLSLTNTANGTWTDTLTASEETAAGKLTFYVKNTATGAISNAVTANYKIDKTAPTGAITLNECGPFQKFLDTITFGLFFKEDVTVQLTASDDASGVKSVEYYKSDKALTLKEVKALADWTADDSFGITVEDAKQFVIYARITDTAGNIAYLSSKGAEFDTTAPTIDGVESGKTYYGTQRVTVKDTSLASVTVNGEPVDMDAPFDLIGGKNAVYTIVATDKAGNVTEYTVTMKPISDITDAIKKLPSADDVKLADKDEIERISEIIDALAENEKALLGEETLGKLTALNERLTELADNAKKPTSPSTGDISDLTLWIALLFISGGVVTGVTVASKKKKQQER